MKPLILIGGGGHCMSVIEAAESAGRTISGILDRPDLVGSEVSGYRIIGTDDDIQRYAAECEFIVTVGSIKSAEKRRILFNRRQTELIRRCEEELFDRAVENGEVKIDTVRSTVS